ncbi:MAG TPA: chloride channel protein, partial [Aggregatilineales bacterium]|nr:chloride channel protein [Aggregatilineales bacterium]
MRTSGEIYSQFNLVKVSLMAVIVGALAGITAKLLHDLIGLVTHLVYYGEFKAEIVSPLQSPLGLFIIFVPAIGGLIIGAMAKWGTPLVRGHGIPEAMVAILKNKSRVSPKVALLKPLSAAISIGSGQPFGAEGPIIQTGGAIGSVIGQMLHMTTSERKVLLACGAAGGLAATFNTPLAAIVFGIELLLFEFRTRSFVPLAISCTVATGIYIQIFGGEPIFTVPETTFGHPLNLIFFLFLGAICGGVGIILTRSLYLLEDIFHRLSINTYLHPAIGGLFVGIVGYFVPTILYPGVDVFGPGYYLIENILNAQYPVLFLIILLIAKAAVWLVSLGSGTSGRTLAPIFM